MRSLIGPLYTAETILVQTRSEFPKKGPSLLKGLYRDPVNSDAGSVYGKPASPKQNPCTILYRDEFLSMILAQGSNEFTFRKIHPQHSSTLFGVSCRNI